MKPLKNANLKKRVLATMVSATVAFGGVAVAAPTADADPRITNMYSALDNVDNGAALEYNKKQSVDRSVDLMSTVYGPGWCIDAHLDVPQSNTAYDIRKLDGTSGFYGFNGDPNSGARIHPDIQKAAINLTKSMLDSYYDGQTEEVRKKNFALQALLSNNLHMLDMMRGYIEGGVTYRSGKKPPEVSQQEFLQWTGFNIGRSYENPLGQSKFYLIKNEQAFSQLKVKSGEYVTVLVPKSYNVYEDLNKEPTNQRIVIIAQPGLEGYEPHRKIVRETVTETPDPTTVTVDRTPETVTVTERVQPTTQVNVETQPTVTRTKYVQPVRNVTVTETPAEVTETAYEQPEMSGVTETFTRQVEPTTVTETAPQETITEYKGEPTTVTETVTETPTVTADASTATSTATETAEPVYVTETVTQPEKTETKTVTAAPKTVVSTVHTTQTNVTEVERTSVVERYYRDYKFAYDFDGKTGNSENIDVNGLGDWTIDFIDDSNGLVKVEKKIVDGKSVLEITPLREGRGTVRIVVVDAEGNRNEYSINVVNEKTEDIVENEVVVNNHFFNVGTSNLQQTIPVPEGWDYEIVEGGNYITTEQVNGGLNLKVNEGVLSGTVKISVFEKVDGEKTGFQNNYVFNIDAKQDSTNQFRVIGNENSYKLEVANVEEKPKIVSGDEALIESIEQDEDGYWIVTPAKDANGQVVIEATDKDGKVYKINLTIKPGLNVQVKYGTYFMDEGGTAEIPGGEDYKIEPADGGDLNDDNWTVTEEGDTFKVTNVTSGTRIFNVYTEIDGEKIIVGVYTLVAKPAQQEKFDPIPTTKNIKDRQTVIITPGKAGSGVNSVKITEGENNATIIKENGEYRILPKQGFEGKIVVEEFVTNAETGEDETIAIHTINVEKSAPSETKESLKANEQANFELDNKDKQSLSIVKGEDLIDAGRSNLQKGEIYFAPNANGEVVIEVLNSRGIAIDRYIYTVTPAEVVKETFDLNNRSTAGINLPGGYKYKVVKGEDLITVEKVDGELKVTPKDGAQGTAIIEVTDENGNVLYRYEFIVDGTNNGSDNSTLNNSFKLTEKGTFKVTRRNDNKIVVQSGGDYVKVVKDDKDEYVLQPKGPDSVGRTVTVVETRDNVVVKRHEIEIVAEPTPLGYREERRVIVDKIKGEIIKGNPTGDFRVLRGEDLIREKKVVNGELTVIPLEDKVGTILVEELDSKGNPVGVYELEVPPTTSHGTSDYGITVPKGNEKQGWKFDVKGGSNNVEINLCKDKDCTNPERLDDKWVKVVRTEDGAKVEILPGAPLDGVTHIELVGIRDGIRGNVEQTIDVTVENGTKVNNGSSELDGKCIASLVGLSAPLLLAIPLGILSQVQIPGLEGLSAQVNNAIRETNDRIQRGLGIYDNDRAQRAAGLQGAFNVANPEMLQLAGGSLAAITIGLFLVDGVLRACGKEEMTSSYKLGEATGQDWLMYGSSGKPAEDAAANESESSSGSSAEGSANAEK